MGVVRGWIVRELPGSLPLLGVILAGFFLIGYANVLGMGDGAPASRGEVELLLRKVVWGAAALVLNMVMVGCLFVLFESCRFLKRYFNRFGRWFFLRFAVAAGVVAVMAGAAALRWELQLDPISPATALLKSHLYNHLPSVELVAVANNLVGVLLVIAFAVVAGALLRVELIRPGSESGRGQLQGKSARELEQRMVAEMGDLARLFRMLVVSAGALIGAALYAIHRLYHWAAALRGGPLQEKLESMASSIALAGGLLFSVLLAAIFLPVAMRLADRQSDFRHFKLGREPDFDWRKWAERHDIRSPLQALSSYFGILLPAISGFTAQLSGAI